MPHVILHFFKKYVVERYFFLALGAALFSFANYSVMHSLPSMYYCLAVGLFTLVYYNINVIWPPKPSLTTFRTFINQHFVTIVFAMAMMVVALFLMLMEAIHWNYLQLILLLVSMTLSAFYLLPLGGRAAPRGRSVPVFKTSAIVLCWAIMATLPHLALLNKHTISLFIINGCFTLLLSLPCEAVDADLERTVGQSNIATIFTMSQLKVLAVMITILEIVTAYIGFKDCMTVFALESVLAMTLFVFNLVPFNKFFFLFVYDGMFYIRFILTTLLSWSSI
ncbi:MAG: hypothetical protein RIQ89_1535 [Bacteroidota bacterium]